ncbi:MAG: ERF family protein [Erysipelotrichia bacterium]|nr:ERF family protein [Erysipelotrichia bacterium]
MEQQQSKLNIYQKMLAISDEMGIVTKNLLVPTGNGKSYKAVSERDVIDAVKPLETKYGVYSYPVSREIIDNAILTTQRNYNGKDVESKQIYLRLQIVYRFVNVEKPDEYIDITSYGDGIDSGDKATGKAMTYADKYALMKAYKMSTGDDPDQEPSQDLVNFEHKMCSDKQMNFIYRLYSQSEIDTMLQRMGKKSFAEVTADEASKMIEARSGKNGTKN